DVVLHRAPDLQVGEVESDFGPQSDAAEGQRDEQQRERDWKADKDDADHGDQHENSQDFLTAHDPDRLRYRSSRGARGASRSAQPTGSSSVPILPAGTAARR